jgi:hypothetical protein
MPIIPPLESLRQEEWSIFSLKKEGSWVWWLMPVILVTQEVEIRRMEVPSLPWQKVCKTPSQLMAGHSSMYLSTSVTWGSTNRRITIQAGLIIK